MYSYKSQAREVNMYTLLQASEAAPYSISLGLVVAVGFTAAVIIGSIAWYNSKRPAGWENTQRPDYIPKVSEEDENS